MSSVSTLTIWNCCKCSGSFIDADEHPELKGKPLRILREKAGSVLGIEPQEYRLGPLEVVCNFCAQQMGLEE